MGTSNSLGHLCTLLLIGSYCLDAVSGIGINVDWGSWWTYEGISGPKFWGLINPEWRLCTHGRRQSPVDLQPHLLLHDPNLGPVHVDKHSVGGVLTNTGHSVVFILDGKDQGSKEGNRSRSRVDASNELVWTKNTRNGKKTDNGLSSGGLFDRMNLGMMKMTDESRGEGKMEAKKRMREEEKRLSTVEISGGPLSYRYQVNHIQFHFGAGRGPGSEHSVNGTALHAEMQIYGYNSQLYGNLSEALSKPHGVVALAVLLQVGDLGHPGLNVILDELPGVKWAGETSRIPSLSIHSLLPPTHHYITYEGSLTQPPCHETLTWVVYNKPLYVTNKQVEFLQQLQGERGHTQARLMSNFRPTQRLFHRTLRTNIDFTGGNNCSPRGKVNFYKANTRT